MALSDNLQTYWKTDESSGNAADASGNGYTLTNTNITYDTGLINNGAVFSGTEPYLTRADGLGISASSAFSVSMWIKPSSNPGVGSFRQLFSWSRTTNPSMFASLMYYTDAVGQKTQIYITNAVTSTEDYYASSFTSGNWYHVVLTASPGGGYALYVNGSSVKTGSVPSAGTWSSNTFFVLGQCRQSDNAIYARYFQGIMDEVGVWSRALTSDEVTALYNSGSGLAYPFSSSTPALVTRRSLLGVGL